MPALSFVEQSILYAILIGSISLSGMHKYALMFCWNCNIKFDVAIATTLWMVHQWPTDKSNFLFISNIISSVNFTPVFIPVRLLFRTYLGSCYLIVRVCVCCNVVLDFCCTVFLLFDSIDLWLSNSDILLLPIFIIIDS